MNWHFKEKTLEPEYCNNKNTVFFKEIQIKLAILFY